MDEKSLELLEFPKVREILASFTSFSAGREMALSLLPAAGASEILPRLEETAEAYRLMSSGTSLSLSGARDVRRDVLEAAVGKKLEPGHLLDILATLTSSKHARSVIGRVSKEAPRLWDIAREIVELSQVENDITRTLNDRGEILDSASPALGNIRQKIRQVHGHLLDKLNGILKSSRNSTYVEEPFVTMRDGRYVIPVKVEHKRQIKGIVHDVSNTGTSVFMEPWATVDLGNSWRELQVEEEREVDRILRAISHDIGSQARVISHNVELLARIDLAMAKGRYADKHKAAVARLMPETAGNGGARRPLKLINARHPLLKGNVTPLTLELGGEISILVITGPNTGGKTVALKTIGLLVLMTKAGLPIPASGDSEIPLFDDVFADIGDEQSIEQALSTFSWHMGNIVRILRKATGNSLVLFDELGSSTDPNEGSAIARAILLHLLSRGIVSVTTTHHRDLTTFAHATPGLQNASLDFDPVSLSPTYRLRVGLPGSSNAIAIASRLGLDQSVIETARGMISEGAHKMDALLADISRERDELAARLDESNKARKEAESLRDKLAAEVSELEGKKKHILNEVREKIESEADSVQRQLQEARIEIKKAASKQRLDEISKSLDETRRQIRATLRPVQTEAACAAHQDLKPLAVGERVWLPEVQLWGTVLSLPNARGDLEVMSGKARLKLGVEHIERSDTPLPETDVPAPRPTNRPAVTPPQQLDLRGKRAEEVSAELDRYLNDASLARLPQVRIVHGFGTGVVRQIVRTALVHHPLVKSFRPADSAQGGDGATLVEL